MLGSAVRPAIRAPHYVRATTLESLFGGLAFLLCFDRVRCERWLHLALAYWTLLSLRGAKAH
jgi:hypothetical protein